MMAIRMMVNFVEDRNALCEIDIEEVEVEPRLDNSGCHCYWVHHAFCIVPTSQRRGRRCIVSVNGIKHVS